VLTEKFFYWPYPTNSLRPGIAELTPVFKGTPLEKYLGEDCETGDIVAHIVLVCRKWNINPWWVVVSGQREQSTFGRKEWDLTAAKAWLGYVGRDKGRSTFPGYYGIYTQIERCVIQTAWYLNKMSVLSWPDYEKMSPWMRYRVGAKLEVEKDGVWDKNRVICDGGEWAQLVYTPHDKALHKNWQIAQDLVPAHYLE